MGMDPVTIGLGVAAVSTVASSVMGKKAADEDTAAAVEASEYNRLLGLRQGRIEEARRRRLARRELSSQRVAFARSGVRLEGSPLEFLADNAAELERDSIEAGIASRSTAELDRKRTRNIRRQGRRAGAAALLGGATQLAGLGMQFGGGGGRF